MKHRLVFIGLALVLFVAVVMSWRPQRPLVTIILIPLAGEGVAKVASVIEKHRTVTLTDMLPRKVEMKRGMGDGD